MSKLILFNKPFNTLCQFTDDQGRETLARYLNGQECANCYPAGRLDYDSEGLMLLTDDGRLQNQIAHPSARCFKTYWVQVEGVITSEAIEQLRQGVDLKDGITAPAKAKCIDEPALWQRIPPIRVRKKIPTAWLSLSISEGRNRQVRRMTAAVGLPTLRLVRIQIGQWQIDNLKPGEYKIETVNMQKQVIKRNPKKTRPKKPQRN